MENEYRSTLQNLKLKTTPKRLAILEVLAQESIYLSPEEIWQRMKKRFQKIGLPTIYRNLEELSEGHVLSKVVLPNRQRYYYLCRNQSHHHHFVCLYCRKVEDIHFCGVKEIEEEVRKRIKGRIFSHILQVNGLCSECSRLKRDGHEG
ncbi:MAG TPA: transcriptional repressor [Nitrospiraceae bacterium]|jgi:Fe2+ or Zn2+ uptake regulation protein|nr:transcriptional repressor [Nitrospiraceae bacterium]